MFQIFCTDDEPLGRAWDKNLQQDFRPDLYFVATQRKDFFLVNCVAVK